MIKFFIKLYKKNHLNFRVWMLSLPLKVIHDKHLALFKTAHAFLILFFKILFFIFSSKCFSYSFLQNTFLNLFFKMLFLIFSSKGFFVAPVQNSDQVLVNLYFYTFINAGAEIDTDSPNSAKSEPGYKMSR